MRRHAFDMTAFVWGVLFLLIAAYTALRNVVKLPLDFKWLLPGALIVAGIVGIANAVRSSRD